MRNEWQAVRNCCPQTDITYIQVVQNCIDLTESGRNMGVGGSILSANAAARSSRHP